MGEGEQIGMAEWMIGSSKYISTAKWVSKKGTIFAIEKDTFFKKINESSPKLILALVNMLNLIELRVTNYTKVHNAIIYPGYYDTNLNVKSYSQQINTIHNQVQRNTL